MPKKKSHFNRQEKVILKILHESRRPMAIREVAEKTQMSWVTAKKYLIKLKERGFIEEG